MSPSQSQLFLPQMPPNNEQMKMVSLSGSQNFEAFPQTKRAIQSREWSTVSLNFDQIETPAYPTNTNDNSDANQRLQVQTTRNNAELGEISARKSPIQFYTPKASFHPIFSSQDQGVQSGK